MEYRLTVTVTEHGRDPASGEKFLQGFIRTHPDVGAVVEQNVETGRLSVTFAFESGDDLTEVSAEGSRIFTEAANATGLPPTEFIEAKLSVVDLEREDEDVLELQPA